LDLAAGDQVLDIVPKVSNDSRKAIICGVLPNSLATSSDVSPVAITWA
jgi:hypothetical protein